MGRKRNQGKARKAAKAKAEERGSDDNQTADSRQQPLATQMKQLQIGAAPVPIPSDKTKCRHGFDKIDNVCIDFVFAFREAFYDEDDVADVTACLLAAEDAAIDKFANVWNDSAKMETVVLFFLCDGTQYFLEGNYDSARDCATFTRFFEQRVAVTLHQTQALMHWPKIYETYLDLHTLVKFFRKRIPCSCLDAKYEEVKATTKMGLCFNPQCKFRRVERSKTMYCSRCRSVTYCSRECQRTHWSQHKPFCDTSAAQIAEFEAKQQNA